MRLLQIILLCSFFLSSCETIKGAGRDVQDGGEALEDAIEG